MISNVRRPLIALALAVPLAVPSTPVMAESIPQAAQYVKAGKLPEPRNRRVAQGVAPAFLGTEDFAKFLGTKLD